VLYFCFCQLTYGVLYLPGTANLFLDSSPLTEDIFNQNGKFKTIAVAFCIRNEVSERVAINKLAGQRLPAVPARPRF
jgi:hypothetical protein